MIFSLYHTQKPRAHNHPPRAEEVLVDSIITEHQGFYCQASLANPQFYLYFFERSYHCQRERCSYSAPTDCVGLSASPQAWVPRDVGVQLSSISIDEFLIEIRFIKAEAWSVGSQTS